MLVVQFISDAKLYSDGYHSIKEGPKQLLTCLPLIYPDGLERTVTESLFLTTFCNC